MTKASWQATALLTLSLLLVTNAAQFHSRRVLAAESAAKAQAGACPPVPAYELPSPQNGEVPTVPAIGPAAIPPGAKCIGGQTLAEVNGVWVVVGTC